MAVRCLPGKLRTLMQKLSTGEFNTTDAVQHVANLIRNKNVRGYIANGAVQHVGKLIEDRYVRGINTIGPNEQEHDDHKYINWEPYLNDEVRMQEDDHCWTIGPVDCLESVYKLYTNETVVLSARHIVDKAPREKDRSKFEEYEKGRCSEGGSVRDAYNFIASNGVALESDWPYSKGPIKEDGRKIFIGGYRRVKGRTEIKKTLKFHPVVGCTAVHPILEFYKGGDIIDSSHLPFFEGTRWADNDLPRCRSTTCPNKGNLVYKFCHICGYSKGYHTVVQTGYDTRVAGQHHWIIRNTHGKEWGQGGYGFLKMTESNEDITKDDVDEAVKQNLPLGVLNVEHFAVYPIPHYSWKKKDGLKWNHY